MSATAPGVNPWLVTPIVALAAFMEVLDISIANVALQHMAGSFSATPEEATWVLTSYLVANAIVLPVSGWMSTAFGRKRFFLSCIVGFTVMSFLCGFAQDLETLILFRVLQGLTGGGLQPSAQSIIADSFPPEKRGMAFALYGMSVVFAPAIGPTLGGIITDQADWRWVFLINVPVGAALFLALAAMIRDPDYMREARERRRLSGRPIDFIGFLLLAVGLGLLQYVLDKGQQKDWFASPEIAWGMTISIVSLSSFVAWVWRREDPIVDLTLLADRNFAISNFLLFVVGLLLLGSTMLLPALVQILLGYSATDAGLIITPGGFLVMLMLPIVGRLVAKVDPRWLLALGLITMSAGLFHVSGLALNADHAAFVWARIYQIAGVAFLFVPTNAVAYVNIPAERMNAASALVNLSRMLGGSVGIALAVAWLERSAAAARSRLAERLNEFDPAFGAARDNLAMLFSTTGADPVEAQMKALGLIGRELARQAGMLAYLEDFRLMALLPLLVLPLIPLLRRTAGQAAH